METNNEVCSFYSAKERRRSEMKQSITSNHIDIVAETSFKEAAEATTRAWRRKHGAVACPPLSHALSTLDGNTWTVVDAEVGETVAIVIDDMAVLSEDLADVEIPVEVDAPEETSVEAEIPKMPEYPRRAWPKPNQSTAKVTIKKRVVFSR
jgi:hypothetical protein